MMRRMDKKHVTPLPTVDAVRATLLDLSGAEVRRLCDQSGVPLTTLWNLRVGQTATPTLETVGRFWHLVPAILAERQAA